MNTSAFVFSVFPAFSVSATATARSRGKRYRPRWSEPGPWLTKPGPDPHRSGPESYSSEIAEHRGNVVTNLFAFGGDRRMNCTEALAHVQDGRDFVRRPACDVKEFSSVTR